MARQGHQVVDQPAVVVPVIEVGLVVDRLRPLDSYRYFLGEGGSGIVWARRTGTYSLLRANSSEAVRRILEEASERGASVISAAQRTGRARMGAPGSSAGLAHRSGICTGGSPDGSLPLLSGILSFGLVSYR